MSIATVWILGDQLLQTHPAIVRAEERYERHEICILLIESDQRLRRQPYQRKKLVLLLSAMRHYAEHLRMEGYQVDYRKAPNFGTALRKHISEISPEAIFSMAASSYQGRRYQNQLVEELSIPFHVVGNSQFLVGRYNPIPSPESKKRYVLEYFYRDMRRHFKILMEEDEPAGGEWNYDKSNRQRLPGDIDPPEPITFPADEITREVMVEVSKFPDGLGSVDGFNYAVDHAGADAAFDDFLRNRLTSFGPYEDALTKRSHVVFHSAISLYLNLGLLEPLPIVKQIEQIYRAGDIPIESAEGYIRQIIGWREFMYWQYWRQMPGMLDQNAWKASAELPSFFWDGNTEMACVRYALGRALRYGYNHHIERLMLLSNFLMLTGVNPRSANDWFMSMYVDAYDWVMPPNVIGMGLNADGGLTATKPYIASANYINKMGDFCSSCIYDHGQRHGRKACPFNFLYWNFILKHEDRLRANPRTSRNVLGLRYLNVEDRELVQLNAKEFIEQMQM